MLGQDLVGALRPTGDEVTAADRATLDVTDAAAVDGAVARARRGGQLRRVDGGRRRRDAGGRGVRGQRDRRGATSPAPRGARARASCRSRPTTCSTAPPTTPYAEDAALAPRSAYGRTKAAGEWAVRARGARPPGRAHRVAVRRGRPVLPQDDRPRRARARRARRGRRPGRPADVDARRGDLVVAAWCWRAPRRGPTTARRRARRPGTSSRGRSSRPAGLDPEIVTPDHQRHRSTAAVGAARRWSVLDHAGAATAGPASRRVRAGLAGPPAGRRAGRVGRRRPSARGRWRRAARPSVVGARRGRAHPPAEPGVREPAAQRSDAGHAVPDGDVGAGRGAPGAPRAPGRGTGRPAGCARR